MRNSKLAPAMRRRSPQILRVLLILSAILILTGCKGKETTVYKPPAGVLNSLEDHVKPKDDDPQDKEDATKPSGSGSALDVKDIGQVVLSDAKGVMENGSAQVSFSGSGGTAILAQDNAALPEGAVSGAYDLVMDADANSNVTLSMVVPKGKKGVTTRIKIGMPYVDSDGESGFVWVPLDTFRDGETVSASVDLADYVGAPGQLLFAGSGSFEDDTIDFGRRLADVADAKEMGVDYAVRFFSENVYQVVSAEKHFSVNIPESRFNDDTGPKSGKLRVEDAQRLCEDLERIFDDYKKDFPRNTRSKWPLNVERSTYKDASGAYGGLTQNTCTLYLNYDMLTEGYKDGDSYDAGSVKMFHTMSHEMFHFIQWEYTNKTLRALWFDEATAVYYEDAEGDKSGEEHSTNPYHEKYLGIRQYNGITPASTFLVGGEAAADDGYARKPLIEYLVRLYGDRFLPDLMPKYTVTSAGEPVEKLLTTVTGSTMPELTRGYYDSMVGKGELDSLYSDPWEICTGTLDNGGLDLRSSGVFTTMAVTGAANEKHAFPLPRYGAHFILVDFRKLPAGYECFSVKLDTPGTTAILFDIYGDSYDQMQVYRSWEEGLEDNYIEGHTYLLMVINESDAHYGGGLVGSTASISVTCEDMNEGYKGSYPTKAEQVPQEYEGTVTRRFMNKVGFKYYYTYETLDAVAKVTLDESGKTMSVRIVSEDGDEVYAETMKYDPSTGTATGAEGSLQMERGDYDGNDLMGVRIFNYFSSGALHAVFEGYGWTNEEKEDEEPAADYSGSYRSEEKPEDYMENHAYGLRNPSGAFENAFKNATISVGKDGSFSGSGSWNQSYSDTENTKSSDGVLSGTRTKNETISASVSIRGKLGEDGSGKYTVTGTVTITGSMSAHAEGHATDGLWYKQHPDPEKTFDFLTEYHCIQNESESWEYTFTISDEDWCDISSKEKKNGNREDALWLNLSTDAKCKGSFQSKRDVTYPKMDWDEIHESHTTPASDEVMVSTLAVYFP